MSLSLLVLLSTMSFTVEKHFCGDVFVDKAIFSEAKDCGMHSGAPEENGCCKEEKIVVEGQEDLKLSFEDLDLDQQVFITCFTCSYLNLFKSLPREENAYTDYAPPLLVYDIHLLDETFLI